MQVKHLDHLNLSVDDLSASISWYGRVFGFQPVEEGVYQGEPWVILKSGDALLCLYEDPSREAPGGAALRARGIHGVNHFGFRITDREAFEDVLEREDVPVNYGGVVEWPHSLAWYVNDPSGYEIEVALWEDDEVRFPAPTPAVMALSR
jgi:catechol 2,3-dioxygenase-like lactoylglutathione lyase family enzyme